MDRKLIKAYSEMTSELLDHFKDLLCSLLGLVSYILCHLFSLPLPHLFKTLLHVIHPATNGIG